MSLAVAMVGAKSRLGDSARIPQLNIAIAAMKHSGAPLGHALGADDVGMNAPSWGLSRRRRSASLKRRERLSMLLRSTAKMREEFE
jgi:hypothetical protein